MSLLTTTFCLTLLLVAARLVGMFVLAPVFGEQAVPRRLRVLIALAIALPLSVQVALPSLPGSFPALMLAMAGEVLVGLAFGYVGRMIFVGIEMGAFHASQQMGLSLAEVYSPTEDATDTLRQFFHLLAIVIFLAVGGHRVLLASLTRSFATLPPMALGQGELLATLTGLLTSSFLLALKVAAPVLIAMLLAGLLMGLLQKTAPAMNLLSIGLPVRVMLGMLLILGMLALGTLPAVISWAVRQMPTQLQIHV